MNLQWQLPGRSSASGSLEVGAFLNDTFNNWHVAWPPYSLDLMPHDFYVRLVKTLFIQHSINIQTLRPRLTWRSCKLPQSCLMKCEANGIPMWTLEHATGLILQNKAPVYAAFLCQILSNKFKRLYFINILQYILNIYLLKYLLQYNQQSAQCSVKYSKTVLIFVPTCFGHTWLWSGQQSLHLKHSVPSRMYWFFPWGWPGLAKTCWNPYWQLYRILYVICLMLVLLG